MDREYERLNSLESWIKVVYDKIKKWKEKKYVDGKDINNIKNEVKEMREILIKEKE